jgi:hypothetical protein
MVLNLGFPVGVEETLYDGGSRQRYEFGAIYFHPSVGAAFESHGLILQTCLDLGEEQSRPGYPLTALEFNSRILAQSWWDLVFRFFPTGATRHPILAPELTAMPGERTSLLPGMKTNPTKRDGYWNGPFFKGRPALPRSSQKSVCSFKISNF